MEPAQDEAEPFDLVDRDGRPLGLQKPRALVHRDGDWHRSLHIWVWASIASEPHLVFQRRSAQKDTHPGKLDVAVTGHLRAGESVEAALREAKEEIGLRLSLDDVLRIGRRRRSDRTRPGVVDNEVQDIFLALSPAEIASLRPSPAEVTGLVALSLSAASKVLCDGGEAMGLLLGGGPPSPEAIRHEDFVPSQDGYYAKALASVSAAILGGRERAWEIA